MDNILDSLNTIIIFDHRTSRIFPPHSKANCTVLKPCDVAQKPLKLTFTVDALLQQHLDAAVKHTDELAHSLDMHVLDFTAYGKDFIKKQKMSPDSFIQMAMQYAFYK